MLSINKLFIYPQLEKAMFSFKKNTLLLPIFTALAIGSINIAEASTTLRLGWTTANSPVDPYAITAHYFQEELERLAPGEFKIQFFPSNQLGNDTEMLQGLQMGTLDAGVITGTQVGTVEPSFQLLDLPFLFSQQQQAHDILDGEVGQDLLNRLDKKGIIGLGFAEAGFRHAINNKRPIIQPADFNGLKLRVQPSALFLSSFKALGANPVGLPWSEAFTAVQQGTVDGLEIPLAVIYANKYASEVSYLSLTHHTYNSLPLVISKRTYSKLSKELQQTIHEAAKNAITRQRETVATNEKGLLDKISEQGMKVNEVENPDAFRTSVQEVYQEYRSKVGNDIFDKVMQQLSK